MKNQIIYLCLLTVLLTLFGCAAQQQPTPVSTPSSSDAPLPSAVPDTILPQELEQTEFSFSSGIGGWCTLLTISPDGTFSGNFTDHDAGTVYISDFSGQFTDVKQIDEYTYTMTVTELTYDKQPDTTWTEGDTTYIATDAYGIGGNKAFTLCLPGTPLASLPEELSDWYRGNGPTIDCYVLFNPSIPSYFFG